jgi:hypothetical protein
LWPSYSEGHKSIDRELWLKVLWEKVSIGKLRLPKVEVPKWTRAIDLRWMHGIGYRTYGTKYSTGKQMLEHLKLLKHRVLK